MSNHKSHHPNFMEEMRQMIWEIDELKPEPEKCNVSCPPFGCPVGPCPGMCYTDKGCDPCCVTKMPKNSPPSTCPPRSYSSRSYPPLSNQVSSYPSTHLHSSHPGQHPTPIIGSSIFNRTREITNPQLISSFNDQTDMNQYNSIAVCQVPPTNRGNCINNNQAQFTQKSLNSNSTQQSQSSTIQVCYPSICPQTFVQPSMMSSTRHGGQIQSPFCPPPPYDHSQCNRQRLQRNNSQFYEHQWQPQSQQLCPPNSPYMVTIPQR